MSRKLTHSYSMFKSASAPLGAVDATIPEDNSSNATDISQVDKASIHVVFSAPNTGILAVFVRNGLNDPFFELNFGAPLAVTADTELNIEMQQLDFKDMYLLWTPSAGAGTITANLHMSSLGA